MTKKELRAGMKRRNTALTDRMRAAASKRLFDRVERLPEFAAARCVALYCALRDEPDTRQVLARWVAAGKRLTVPRVEGDAMRFYMYDPLEMAPGAFGIEEPASGALLCDPWLIDLVIVPGVAFTAAGARLGRGRGYYDRYLCGEGVRAVKVGVCYRHQLVGELPVEPHDVFMDYICTD